MQVVPDDPNELMKCSLAVVNLDAAYVSLLNAQAETDRLCANNSIQSILNYCDKRKILQAIFAACSMYEYYAGLSARLLQQLGQIGAEGAIAPARRVQSLRIREIPDEVNGTKLL